MNTKWKIILVVMLVIVSICSVFTSLFILDSRENLNNFVDTTIDSIRVIVKTVEEGNSRHYKSRIKSFVNYSENPKQKQIISTFAKRDRDELLQLSTPYLSLFKKENPYFSTLAWITPDNYNFLRVHQPTLSGDQIDNMRPDIVDANINHQQNTGYMVAGKGLQYCLVQPVSYEGRHVGVVQFGLKESLLLDTLEEKLNIPVGMAIPNTKFSFIVNNKLPSLKGNSHTIQTKKVDLFQHDADIIDWDLDQQKITLQGKTYIIVNAFNLLNYREETQGYIFVALDISKQEEKLQSRIGFLLLLSSALLLLSFFILNSSYDSLIQKIIHLNRSLKKNNLELENRVHERTAKLVKSEKQLQEILNQAPLGILIADTQSMQFKYVNPFIARMLGYDKKELENMGINALHAPADLDQITKDFKELVQGKRNNSTDIPFLRKDGTTFEADIISASIELDGKPCLLAFIVDRTKSKKLAIQLHRAQKMEAIGMMAGGVAHDLNNILSGIVSYPELMLLTLPPSSELRKPLEAIQESGQRAAMVVADLLTVARGAATTRGSHDINVLIQEYLNSPECKKLKFLHPAVECAAQLNAEYPIISCSPIHIKKTLMNLMTNAAESIGNGGNILVSTCNRQVDKSETLEHVMEPGHYVVLTVQDSGSGISDKDLEHIFEPFYTKKVMGKSGTGLGLAIVWNTVQDHNGRIFVESSKKGTRFLLYFPVRMSKGKEFAQTANDKTEQLTGNSEHILVVDDEPQLRDIACQMLKTLGYVVDSVCSGELAIKYMKEKPVDLIVIDMLMEPGMNGRQTYEEILKLYPEQKAIIVSGFSENEDVKAALQLGVGKFIKKPYSINQLGQVVKEVLN